MTSLQEQLLKDLRRKLAVDMANACEHFVDMCEVAEIPSHETTGVLFVSLIDKAINLALQAGASPKVLGQALNMAKRHVVEK